MDPRGRKRLQSQRLSAQVPPGWKRLWRDTWVRLEQAAHDSARRAILESMHVCATGEFLQVIFVGGEDRVLDGIAARCTRRSLTLCRQCGRAGKERVFDHYDREVLCARCATPRLLAHEVAAFRAMLPLLNLMSTIHVKRVPPLLRRSFIRAANATSPREAEMGITEFEHWLSGLRVVAESPASDGGRT